MTQAPNPALYAPDAERAVLGAILLAEEHLTALLVDEHLRPEHFADPGRAAIYQAAIELQDADRPIDHLTVTARLADTGKLTVAGGAAAVEELVGWVPATGNAREYGRVIRERSQARAVVTGAKQLQAEVLNRSHPIEQVLEHADKLLADIAKDGRHGREQHSWTPEQIRDWYLDDLGRPAGGAWPTGFKALDWLLRGGLRRGNMALVGGWEKQGKSILCDQVLEHLADQDLNARLYFNEGAQSERIDRMVARLTGIPFDNLLTRNLTTEQLREVVAAMGRIKVGITEITDWTAAEIAREIKRDRPDVCCVDIAHNIPKTEPGVAGADDIARELRNAATKAKTAMLVAVHLNNSRAVGSQNPPPVSRDIRDTGMWARLADQVLFVHRDEDQMGIPGTDGAIIAARVRNGEPGVVRVLFEPERMKFVSSLPTGIRADQYRPPERTADSWMGDSSREFEVAPGVRF